MKSIVDEVGLDFPAIPQLDIDGHTMAITPEDVLIAAL